jgi:hypothetical protein
MIVQRFLVAAGGSSATESYVALRPFVRIYGRRSKHGCRALRRSIRSSSVIRLDMAGITSAKRRQLWNRK